MKNLLECCLELSDDFVKDKIGRHCGSCIFND